MEKRVLLAVILSLLVLYFFEAYFAPPKKQNLTQKPEEEATENAKEVRDEKINYPANSLSNFPEKEIRVETPLYTAIFSSRGAVLKSWSLKKYLDQIGTKGRPIEMVSGKTWNEFPFRLALIGANGAEWVDIPFDSDKEVLTLSDKPEKGEIVFWGKTSEGILVKKTFVFYPQNYLIKINLEVLPSSSSPQLKGVMISWVRKLDPKKDVSSNLGFIGPAVCRDGKVKEIKLKNIDAEGESFSEGVKWIGYEDKYFLAAFLPDNQALISAKILKTEQNSLLINCFQSLKTSLGPEKAGSFSFGFYCGPKDIDLLKSLNRDLEKVIDFGMFDIVAKPLLYILKYLNKFTHNYGLAIILLTVILKVIFFPLTHKSYKSMKALKDLQPQMNALKKKYSNDKERLNRELFELYRTYKVNPLGGCLPLLVQFPIFIAFYWVLLGSIELRHAPFAFWIKDLSSHDPYYITPILMGISMFIQQKMTPTVGDPTQAKVMLAMPIVFTFLFLKFPSGLVIYWLVNNILQIFQQIYIDKRIS